MILSTNKDVPFFSKKFYNEDEEQSRQILECYNDRIVQHLPAENNVLDFDEQKNKYIEMSRMNFVKENEWRNETNKYDENKAASIVESLHQATLGRKTSRYEFH